MSDRALVLARVRAALSSREPTPYPDYADDMSVSVADLSDPLGAFVAALERVGGRVFHDARALAAWLYQAGARRGYVDPSLVPALAPSFGSLVLDPVFDEARVDDYAFGITRATAGIAETGSVVLTDRGTLRRLGALAPWIHVAVLDRRDLLGTVLDALRTLGDDPNVIWVTGPSKTADIEGILIEGVHGPGEQAVLLL